MMKDAEMSSTKSLGVGKNQKTPTRVWSFISAEMIVLDMKRKCRLITARPVPDPIFLLVSWNAVE